MNKETFETYKKVFSEISGEVVRYIHTKTESDSKKICSLKISGVDGEFFNEPETRIFILDYLNHDFYCINGFNGYEKAANFLQNVDIEICEQIGYMTRLKGIVTLQRKEYPGLYVFSMKGRSALSQYPTGFEDEMHEGKGIKLGYKESLKKIDATPELRSLIEDQIEFHRKIDMNSETPVSSERETHKAINALFNFQIHSRALKERYPYYKEYPRYFLEVNSPAILEYWESYKKENEGKGYDFVLGNFLNEINGKNSGYLDREMFEELIKRET